MCACYMGQFFSFHSSGSPGNPRGRISVWMSMISAYQIRKLAGVDVCNQSNSLTPFCHSKSHLQRQHLLYKLRRNPYLDAPIEAPELELIVGIFVEQFVLVDLLSALSLLFVPADARLVPVHKDGTCSSCQYQVLGVDWGPVGLLSLGAHDAGELEEVHLVQSHLRTVHVRHVTLAHLPVVQESVPLVHAAQPPRVEQQSAL